MIKAFPSLFLLFFVIAGIVLANYRPVSPLLGLAAAVLAAGLAILAFLRHRPVATALLAGGAIGLIAAVNFGLQLRGIGPNHLSSVLTDPSLGQVCGRVADWPDLKQGRTEIRIRIDSLTLEDRQTLREVHGDLLLKVTDTTTAFQRGDRIAFQARLYPVRSEERDDNGYGRYLNLRGIFAQAFLPTVLTVQVDRRPSVGFWPMVDRVRAGVCGSLQRNLSPTPSALAKGFLIGETRDIPSEIYARFRDSGTLHVLAVSGANVALVLLFCLWLMRPLALGPAARAATLMGVILIFSGVSYGDPSVVRASIMAALVLGARLLGRVYDLNNIIAATALVVLLVAPTELFDVGFQLSFATAWGLIFIVPQLGDAFGQVRERAWYRWLVMPVLVSVVAQIASAPLILFYFERLPTVSLAANLVIVPLVSIGVIGIMILLLADLIWPLLGLMVGSLVDLWLRGLLAALDFFGGSRAPVWESNFLAGTPWGPAIVVLSYLVLVLAVVAVSRRWARRALLVLVAGTVNLALVVGVLASCHESEAEVRVERVPGGLAVLVSAGTDAPAELVVTGLSRTSGSVDAVLTAVLRRNGVKRLDRLTVLGADFDALADLLRLAHSFPVDSLCVHRGLERSVGDLRLRGDSTLSCGPFRFFGGRLVQPEGPGCYLSDEGVCLVTASFRADIVDRPSSAPSPSLSPDRANYLVIGSRWKPRAEEWIGLRRAGYGQIICASFEQPETSVWPDAEVEPDAAPPDYVVDLSRRGSIRLSFGR